MVHSHYESYQESKDERMLDEIISILYRKRKSFWSIRKYFSDSEDPGPGSGTGHCPKGKM